MTVNDSMKLATSYLAGNASAEEEKLFNEWLQESAANKELFLDLQKIWDNSSITLKVDEPETDAEWKRLAARIESERNTTRSFLKNHWLKIAASLVVILVSYWILDKKSNAPTGHPDTIIAAEDKDNFFYLPDSSKVWLAAHSTLSFEDSYGEEKREVHLKGEGQFDVEHDSLHPFYVMTDEVVIRVVGTSFNVKEDSVVTVTVTEGKVRIYSRESPEHSVMVEKGEQAYIKKQKNARPVKVKKDRVPSGIKPKYNVDSEPGEYADSEQENSAVPERKDNAVSEDDNNVVSETEVNNPLSYLSVQSSWKKNQFNQSVIDGIIVNKASRTTYKNINLKISFTRENGKTSTTYITVYETVRPGERLDFHKNMVDMFANTKDLKIEIDKAEVDYPFN